MARRGLDSQTCGFESADEFAHVLPHVVDVYSTLQSTFSIGRPARCQATSAGNLSCAVTQRSFRSDGVLAEVDRSLSFGIEDVPCERDGDRAWRGAVAAALEFGPEVEQLRLAVL